MEQFVIRKNTLPYVHQWAIIDRKTGNKVGEYKTEQIALLALYNLEKNGLPDNNNSQSEPKTAWDAANERMKRPNGDPLPEPPKHSNKRRVELD